MYWQLLTKPQKALASKYMPSAKLGLFKTDTVLKVLQ